MSKKGSVFDTLLTVGAFIGGAFLLGAALEALGKKKLYYRCPNCNFGEIEFQTPTCPNCHTHLEWNGIENAEVQQ